MDFRGSRSPTLGVEYELQLLDADTLDLAEGILPLLALFPDDPHVKPEFTQCTVELASQPCTGVEELHTHMRAQLRALRAKCRSLGMRLCGAGTHPFYGGVAHITPLPRYQRMEAQAGYLTHFQITHAMHVHVGVADAEQAVRVTRRLRPYLAVLLALSANSPFWRGQDTQWASYRQRIIVAAHAYGPPPKFDTWQDFQDIVACARRAQIFETFRDMHWDLRPRPDLGTIEVRVMDAQARLRRVLGFAALVAALVEHAKHAAADPALLPELPLWLETENLYRASHEALNATYVLNARGDTRAMKAVAEDLLATVRPAAAARGEAQWLQEIEHIIHHGTDADRQRARYRASGSLRQVVAALAEEFEADLL